MKSTGWAAIAVCGLVATTAATAAEQTASAPRVVAFNASVQVEVDAAGQPIKVAAPADLPEAIRGDNGFGSTGLSLVDLNAS